MKEASLVKFYFAKYFFLALGLLQWIISSVFILRQGDSPKGQYAAFVLFTIGLLLVSLQLVFATRLKRVAVGKKKIAVTVFNKTHRYEWDEIKSIRFLPMFNLYSMKIRGKKQRIYFLPSEESEVIYGLFPSVAGMTKKGK